MSTSTIAKACYGAAGAAAVVALIAGCSSSSSSGKQATATSGVSSSGLKSAPTSIGEVLVAPSGRTVYELVGDSATKQTCVGECLAIWPAVTSNGHQVVVNGHPAFTYVGDHAAGQTKGQNVTDQWGRWLALDASGNPIRGSSAPTSKAPGSKPSTTTSKAPAGGGPAF